jgi:hypothetical protein
MWWSPQFEPIYSKRLFVELRRCGDRARDVLDSSVVAADLLFFESPMQLSD